ncbi:hypothetical protein HDV06_005039 [Boothiomyces sp. JEL0866]|nr:hypothetical protein HDV06_005039 [Boothiomyces sp. JEL0866]
MDSVKAFQDFLNGGPTKESKQTPKSPEQKLQDQINIHQAIEQIDTEYPPVAFQITEMKDSYMIWIGEATQGEAVTGQLDQLAVALKSPYQDTPIASTLIKPTMENLSETIAKKLSQRFRKQFFVSFNLEMKDPEISSKIQAKLFELVKSLN